MYIKRTYFGENQFCQIWRFVLVFASIKDSDVAIRQLKFLEKKKFLQCSLWFPCGSRIFKIYVRDFKTHPLIFVIIKNEIYCVPLILRLINNSNNLKKPLKFYQNKVNNKNKILHLFVFAF